MSTLKHSADWNPIAVSWHPVSSGSRFEARLRLERWQPHYEVWSARVSGVELQSGSGSFRADPVQRLYPEHSFCQLAATCSHCLGHRDCKRSQDHRSSHVLAMSASLFLWLVAAGEANRQSDAVQWGDRDCVGMLNLSRGLMRSKGPNGSPLFHWVANMLPEHVSRFWLRSPLLRQAGRKPFQRLGSIRAQGSFKGRSIMMAFRIALGLVLLGLPLAKGLTFSHSQGGDTATWELHLHGDELHVTQ
ncbi:unnamed protein product [Symbiodinium sp. KB8]|nr:unnamed protein product [Symbiodinium sp. KB8]